MQLANDDALRLINAAREIALHHLGQAVLSQATGDIHVADESLTAAWAVADVLRRSHVADVQELSARLDDAAYALFEGV